MDQTALHENFNPALFSYLPTDAKTLVEIGCNGGGMAREYKKLNASCRYIGVDIVPEYVELAKRYCDRVIALDIESVDINFLKEELNSECWIFADVLEHLRDPWGLLKKIRQIIPANGCIVACIPNAQHWSIQARLNTGLFRYEDSGLMDRTHIRWFTRGTIIEMFAEAGYLVTDGLPRVFELPDEKLLSSIRQMAEVCGIDPEVAANDALPFQYVIKAVPINPKPD